MQSFLCVSGVVVVLVTILLAIFKKEKDNRLEDGYVKINVFQNYKLLWDILKLPHIQILAIALLTARIGFSAMDSVSNLKLIDAGISKDDIMMITIATYVIKLCMPIFVSKYTTSPKPMSYYLKITPVRLLWAVTYVVLIHYTPSLIRNNEVVSIPVYYYFLLGIVCLMNEMMNFFMLLTLYAFFCRLSDPRYGGTYMTLFNTFYYSGFLISHTLVLKLVDVLTFMQCPVGALNSCPDSNELCETNRRSCDVYVDGYYVAIAICMIIGFIWYGVFRNVIKTYQSLSLPHWKINIVTPKELNKSRNILTA